MIDAHTGAIVARTAGKAVGAQTISIPADGLDPGSYQYTLHALKCGKPGTAESRYSRPFAVTLPAGADAGPTAPYTEQLGPTTKLPELPQARGPLPTLLPTVPAAS